jgi:predicted nucleic acid-binding OB-fold protein
MTQRRAVRLALLRGLRERSRDAITEARTARDALTAYMDTVQRVEFQKRQAHILHARHVT